MCVPQTHCKYSTFYLIEQINTELFSVKIYLVNYIPCNVVNLPGKICVSGKHISEINYIYLQL